MSFSGEAKLEIRVALHDSPGKKLTSAMGLNDEKVKGILGQEAWEILCSSVISGELHALKMKETARKLHPSVGGNHQRRTGPTGRRDSDWHEMREVLSDWYQLELFEFESDRGWALQKLIAIFKSDAVELPNVARQLEKLSTNLTYVMQH